MANPSTWVQEQPELDSEMLSQKQKKIVLAKPS
jgi:hypothetical protein